MNKTNHMVIESDAYESVRIPILKLDDVELGNVKIYN